MKIQAQVIAHSKNEFGDELITFVVTFPRIILAELNTHRMFSRNSASSRAIPFNKMVESVKNDPFIPIAWQKEHKGMQGTEYFTDPFDIGKNVEIHLAARDFAITCATNQTNRGVTKQIANRYIELFMWHTVIITTGKEGLNNFFDLRCPSYGDKGFKSWKDYAYNEYTHSLNNKTIRDWATTPILQKLQINKGQAEIHMMALAEAMYDAYNESIPEQLKAGEWHIPYKKEIEEQFGEYYPFNNLNKEIPDAAWISSIMCARVSYTVVGHDPTEWTFKKYIDKAEELAKAKPLHASPFEHPNKTMNKFEYNTVYQGNDMKEDGWCRNFRGFIQLRHMIENSQYYNKNNKN